MPTPIIDIVKRTDIKDEEKIKLIEIELKHGASWDEREKEYKATILHEACLNGGSVLLNWILEKKPDLIHAKTASGTNVLFFAAKYGNQAAVEFLLQHTEGLALAKAVNVMKLTVNWYAIPGNNLALIKLLQNIRGDKRLSAEEKDTNAHLNNAIQVWIQTRPKQDFIPMLGFLSEEYTTLFQENVTATFNTVLTLRGEMALLIFFINQFQIDLNIPNLKRSIFSCFSAKDDHSFAIKEPDNKPVTVFKYLEEKGFDRTKYDDTGLHPIHLAAMNGSVEILEYLLTSQPKVDPNLLTVDLSNGCNALHYAVNSKKNGLAMTQLLINFGCNGNLRDKNNQTPLMNAVFYLKDIEIVKLLLQTYQINAKADLFPSTPGYTLTHLAAKNGCIEVLEELKKREQVVDKPDSLGKSPIHYAADTYKNIKETINFFCQLNPENLNLPDKYGQTPLHISIAESNVSAIDCLLKLRANYSTLDARKLTPALSIFSKPLPDIDILKTAKLKTNTAILLKLFHFHIFRFKNTWDFLRALPIPLRIKLLARILSSADQPQMTLSQLKIKLELNEKNFAEFFGYSETEFLELNTTQVSYLKTLEKITYLPSATKSAGDEKSVSIQPEEKKGLLPTPKIIDSFQGEIHSEYEITLWMTEVSKNLFEDPLLLLHQESILKILQAISSFKFLEAIELMTQCDDFIRAKLLSAHNFLLLALTNGSEELFDYVRFEQKIDLKSEDPTMKHALHLACCSQNLDLVKKLMDYGFTHQFNEFGMLPLHYAAFHGRGEIIRYLVREQKHSPYTTTQDENIPGFGMVAGSNLAHIAACNPDTRLFQMLGEWKALAELHKPNDDGRFPIHVAASHGHLEALHSWIIDEKIDVNLPDAIGNTPLHYAAIEKQDKAVAFLLKQGASPLQKNKYNQCPSYYAFIFQELLSPKLSQENFADQIVQTLKQLYHPSAFALGHLSIMYNIPLPAKQKLELLTFILSEDNEPMLNFNFSKVVLFAKPLKSLFAADEKQLLKMVNDISRTKKWFSTDSLSKLPEIEDVRDNVVELTAITKQISQFQSLPFDIVEHIFSFFGSPDLPHSTLMILVATSQILFDAYEQANPRKMRGTKKPSLFPASLPPKEAKGDAKGETKTSSMHLIQSKIAFWNRLQSLPIRPASGTKAKPVILKPASQ